jgi:uncharacterized FlaG/YvyC family protein
MKVHAMPDTTTLVREAKDAGKVVGKIQSETKIETTRHKPEEPRPTTKNVQPRATDGFSVRLQFAVDKDTGEQLVKVLDPETGDVIRQFPPEELLHVMKTLRDLKGVLLSARL